MRLAGRTRTLGECARIGAGGGSTRPGWLHLGRRHGGDVPHVAAARPRGRAARRRGGADQGRSRPAQGHGGAAADRPRAARFPDAQHLRDPAFRPAWRCTWPASAARKCRRRCWRSRRRARTPRGNCARRSACCAATEDGDCSGLGQLDSLVARARAAGLAGDGDRDRRRAAPSARRGPGRLPDRAGSAHQREPSRRPGVRVGSPALRAGRPLGPGRRRRRGHHQHGRPGRPAPAWA